MYYELVYFLLPDAPVTEDMLVTHFLIEPDPEGRIKIPGFNEIAFGMLA